MLRTSFPVSAQRPCSIWGTTVSKFTQVYASKQANRVLQGMDQSKYPEWDRLLHRFLLLILRSIQTFGYCCTRQCNDSTHIPTPVTHKAGCLSLTASFITVVSEEWLLPLGGWGRPSGCTTRASETSWGEEKKKKECSPLSVTWYTCRTYRTGQPQQEEGINIFLEDLGMVDMSAKHKARCPDTCK